MQTAKYLIQNAEENEELSEEQRAFVRSREMRRLEEMTAYCKTTSCLRARLLAYFGEAGRERCGNCGNCLAEMVESDITIPAQKILSAVARIERQHPYGLGLTILVRMLRGSREQRVLQLGLDRLPTYGVMRDASAEQIREYVDRLTDMGYLSLSEGEYPVLRLTSQAGDVLYRGEKVICVSRRERPGIRRAVCESATHEAAQDLLAALRRLRADLARQENVPAYIIFSNAALSDMAVKRPRSMAEFLQVSGVGQIKAERYGKAFLDEIRRWAQD